MKLIPLTKGYSAMVDNEDFERINQYKWHIGIEETRKYALRTIHVKGQKDKSQRMHRLVLNYFGKLDIDHKDLDGINNQKSNLRICTHSQNLQNTLKAVDNKSGYKGVTWHYDYDKKWGKWLARIRINKKLIFLGYFDDKKEAAIAYNKAVIKYFGEFGRLNVV